MSSSIRNDSSVDLTTIFKDNAGLRIARFVVREILKEADKQRFAGDAEPFFGQDTFCSVSPLRFDSNPEFRRMLEDRLVFRESEPLTSGQGHLGRSGISRTSSEGFDMSRDCKAPLIDAVGIYQASGGACADVYFPVNRARAEQSHQQANSFADIHTMSHFSYQQRPTHPSSFRTSQIRPGTLSHPQFRQAKSQAELDIDALFEEPASKNQGTESPYRVESPSGRASGLSSSQRSPQRWNENDTFASHLPSVEKDPFQLDRGSYSNSSPLNYSSQSSVPRQRYLSDSGYFSGLQTPSASNSQSQQHNNNISHYAVPSARQPSPSIKSFLPVNKTTETGASLHVSHAGKNLGFSHSLSDSPAPRKGLDSPFQDHDNSAQNHNTTQSLPTQIKSHPSSSSTQQPQFDFEQFPHPAENNRDKAMELSTTNPASKKRKAKTDDPSSTKKLKTGKTDKPKRVPKPKEEKPEPVSTSNHLRQTVLTFHRQSIE